MVSADSLSYTSALSVALAVLFVVITAGIAIVKMVGGSIPMPRLFPDVTDLSSFWKLFTVVPVVVTAYICHYNGIICSSQFNSPNSPCSLILFPCMEFISR